MIAITLTGLAACERGVERADPVPDPAPATADGQRDTMGPGHAPMADAADEGAASPADYRLTRPDVERFARASGDLRRLAERDPAPMHRLRANETSNPSTSLAETAARLESEPAVREVIESAGLSPREYALITLTLSEAILVQQALTQGSIDGPPSGVSEQNLEFVREHRDEINRLLSRAARDR